MHMTFEKIDPPENPAVDIARTIKQLHLDTIKMMDGGFVYHADGVNVNDKMRAACQEQIDLCDEIIATSSTLSAALLAPVTLLLEDARADIEKRLKAATAEELAVEDSALPEIGNYDHKT